MPSKLFYMNLKYFLFLQILGSTITNLYEQEGIEREIRVHSKCNHHNIVRLFDSFYEDDNIYLILEYVPNGNLFSFIQKNHYLSEEEACRVLVQISLALSYLHENNIYHRDIKPENILMDENYDIKLCDFGWCAENIHQKRKTFCGTYEYMAPEIILDLPYDYTIDIWAIGILLYELVHGFAPFRGKDYNEIASGIKACQFVNRSNLSKPLVNLITMIIQKDPLMRPSIRKILTSPFVKQYRMNLVTQSEEMNDNSNMNESKVYLSPKPHQRPQGRGKSPQQKKMVQLIQQFKGQALTNLKLFHKQSNSLANIFTSVSPSKAGNRKLSKQFYQSPTGKKKETPLKDKTQQTQNAQTKKPSKVISLQASESKFDQENIKPVVKKPNSKRGKMSLYAIGSIKLYTQQSPPRKFAESPKKKEDKKKSNKIIDPPKRVFIGLYE